MKKVVLTGSTGLIGKEATKPLEDAGFEVHCLTSTNCNLFDETAVNEFFRKIKPEYLLHFAWFTGEGYLESDLNEKYIAASMNMLEIFKQNGGKRAVFAGTCFEYNFKDERLKETDPVKPTTLYAISKNKLREYAEIYCAQNDLSFGWGRIFYVFGKNEHEKRLTGHLINKLRQNKTVEIKCGQLIKDYMYTKDIANAFVKFLDSDVQGIVNICTGKGISLKDYSILIAEKLQKTELLRIQSEQTNQPAKIVGDNTRLTKEVNFTCEFSIEKAIDEILEEENAY